MKKKLKKRISSFTISFILVATIISAFFVIMPSPVKAAWWNSDWDYYKVLNIDNSNNSYAMFVNVSYATGGNVSCDSHCQLDFDDIRFLDIDNSTELSYWREHTNTDKNFAWFWVNTSSDLITDTKFLIYYGNVAASYTGNGSNVFYYFDNFTTDSPSTWTNTSDGVTNHHYTLPKPHDYRQTRIRWKMNVTQWENHATTATVWFGYNKELGTSSQKVTTSIDAPTAGDLANKFGYRLWCNDAVDDGRAYTDAIAPAKVLGKNITSDLIITNQSGFANTKAWWHNNGTFLMDASAHVTTNIPLESNINYLWFRLTHGDDAGFAYKFEWANSDYLHILTDRGGASGVIELYFDWIAIGGFNGTSEPVIGSSSSEYENAGGGTVPVNSNPSPLNSATGVALNPTLAITINDPNGDTMQHTFRTNASGAWTTLKTTSNSANATLNCPTTCFSSTNTKYWWSSNVTDSTEWDNDTYYFTTNHTYTWSIEKGSNITLFDTTDGFDYTNVNYTINITNTGSGAITDINLNETWYNCSCSDWKFTIVETNISMSDITFYNDSCYASINVANIAGGSTYRCYIIVNVSECENNVAGTVTNTANITGVYVAPTQDTATLSWGGSLAVRVNYLPYTVYIDDTASSVFDIIGIIFIIGAILLIIPIAMKR